MQALLGEHFLQYSRRWRATEKPPQGVPERPLEASRKGPGGSREAPGRDPGAKMALGGVLEPSWKPLGRLLGRLGGVLGALGCLLGRLGGVLGSSWGLLGAS